MYEIALLTSIVLFVACGDDSSSSPKVILPSEVENADELKSYECNMSVIGEKVFVESEEKNYECDGDHWFESFDTGKLSSSSKKTSSSSSAALSSSIDFNAGSEYDEIANTLKDLRDGQIYRTVKIGKQVWMAENLNLARSFSYCYNDSVEYCARYGRLYTWTVSACPKNWHLPTDAEFKILFDTVGGSRIAGKKLKTANGWNCEENRDCNGTDDYFFSALPSGCRDDSGKFFGLNSWTHFWSESYGTSIYNSNSLFLEKADAANLYPIGHYYACPIRCVKD